MEEHTLKVLEFEAVKQYLASFAQTEIGKKACLNVAPAGNSQEAKKILLETAEFARFRQERSFASVGAVGDAEEALKRCQAYHRSLEPEELREISRIIKKAQGLRETFLSLPEEKYPLLRKRASELDLPLDLSQLIDSCIDERGRIVDWASEKLRDLRERVSELRQSIRSRVQVLCRKPHLSRFLQEETWTIRNERFVLAVRREHRDRVKGVLHGYSQTGSTAYVEPEEVVVQGNELQAALEALRREEARILLELTKEVLQKKDRILQIQSFLAWADLNYAKTEWVRLYRFSVPELSEDGVLCLHRSRHPLLLWYRAGKKLKDPDLEELFREVVPLDLELGRDFRILVITGPNTGGKTVALKTIGLACVMAASGLPVACRGPTRIPFYREIFVDVGDEQSLQQSLSTFSSHMRHVVRVVRGASSGDLVLLDEFGSGTDPLEGASLGTVILRELSRRGCHVVVTTHLGSLKEYAYTHPEAANAAMTFDPATLAPTYRMIVGAPGKSCALLVAQRLGLPASLIQEAKELLRNPAPQEKIMERMEKAKKAAEAEKRRAQRERRRVERLREKLSRELREVKKKERVLAREAEQEIEEKIKQVRDTLKEIVPKLMNVPQALRPCVERLKELAENVLTVTPLGQRREEFARSLKEHSQVYIPRLDAVCTVLKVNKNKRRLLVKGEGFEAEVTFDDISWVPPSDSGSATGV